MDRLSRLVHLLVLDPESPQKRGNKSNDKRHLTCLLTPLPSGEELSLALVHYLADEIPDVRFTLDASEPADAVWVCGHGESAAAFLRRFRALHPNAMIVVTGRAPAETWTRAVIAAGADFACSWPVDYGLLARILHRRHIVPETAVNRLRALGL